MNNDKVISLIQADFDKRLADIKHMLTDDDRESTAIVHKVLDLMETDSTGAYSLLSELHITGFDIDSMCNLGSFVGNLFDDSYFRLKYGRENDKLFDKKYIHLSDFHLVWSNDSFNNNIYSKHMGEFLDWYINFAKNQFIYTKDHYGCSPGPTYHLGLIKDWNLYPVYFKQSYDLWKADQGE